MYIKLTFSGANVKILILGGVPLKKAFLTLLLSGLLALSGCAAIQLGITGVDERVPVSRRRVVPLKKALSL